MDRIEGELWPAAQGTFVECAAPAPATAQLAAAVLELLGAPGVHAHPEPFVRRSVLVAASQAWGPPHPCLLTQVPRVT